MTTPDPAVTVVIPTLGLRERAARLHAAIQSALDQRGVATIVRVVLNGSKGDPQVERELPDNVRIALVVRDARGGARSQAQGLRSQAHQYLCPAQGSISLALARTRSN